MHDQGLSSIVLTRKELFKKVWTTPMIRLAKDFGLSDVGLRKACHRHNIPTPPAGHWSKKLHGKAGPEPELPPNPNQSSDEIRFEPEDVANPRDISEGPQPKHAEVAQALEHEACAPLIEWRELRSNMPSLVANTYRALRAAKPRDYGESFGRVRTSSHLGEYLAVDVGPNSVVRCMQFLNTLIRALEARGYKLLYKDQGYDTGLRLSILGEELSFRMFEPSRRKDHVLTAKEREDKKLYPNSCWHKKFDYDPCGQMEFSVTGHGFYGSSATWRDTSKRPFESIVNEVIVRMLWIVDELKTKREERVREERERAERERQRREAEEKRRREEARVRALLKELKSWERSMRIRRYVRAVEKSALSRPSGIEPGSELEACLKWAKQVADGMDPLRVAQEN